MTKEEPKWKKALISNIWKINNFDVFSFKTRWREICIDYERCDLYIDYIEPLYEWLAFNEKFFCLCFAFDLFITFIDFLFFYSKKLFWLTINTFFVTVTIKEEKKHTEKRISWFWMGDILLLHIWWYVYTTC